MRISAPPGATVGKGTCGCCVSCSRKNPTFLCRLAQSPGAGLHPTILLLREEGENQVSEGNTRPAPSSTALHRIHSRSLGAANLKYLLTTSRNSFACPTNHGDRFPNCSTATAPSDLTAHRDFYVYQNWLRMVGGILFAVPILKKSHNYPK